MKKLFFTLTLTLIPFYTFAYEGTISQSGSCGATDADCHYDLYEDGHLEISGTGKMSDFYYPTGNAAPWAPDDGPDIYDNPVKSVNINGVTSIGQWAFLWCNNLENVQISDSVKEVNTGAFEQSGNHIENIIIPSSVEKITGWAFTNSDTANIIIEGTPELIGNVFTNTRNAKIYCSSEIDCTNKGVYHDIDYQGTVIPYDKDSGVYILDGQMYTTPIDMANTQNACVDMDTCKAKVLKNKGYCSSDEACAAMVEAENANHPIEYKNKSYATIDDLLKGKHMPKRIYIIDEANRVAGTKNRVSIKYR